MEELERHLAWLHDNLSDQKVWQHLEYTLPFLEGFLRDNSIDLKPGFPPVEACRTDETSRQIFRSLFSDRFEFLMFDADDTTRIYDVATQDVLLVIDDYCKKPHLEPTERYDICRQISYIVEKIQFTIAETLSTYDQALQMGLVFETLRSGLEGEIRRLGQENRLALRNI